jgi:hypothetical protein
LKARDVVGTKATELNEAIGKFYAGIDVVWDIC